MKIEFKDAYFHIPIQNHQEISEMSCPGQNIPVQSTTIWSVHSSLGVHCSNQRTDGFTEGYKNPPVPRRLVGPQASFRLCWFPVLPERSTLDRWQTLTTKIRELLTKPTCPVRQLMSLIGLLTATKKNPKNVHLGLLHMRPIQWHLKTGGSRNH